MKTASSDLYDLIHGLEKSEKRYIKIHAGKENADYLQLIEALRRQKNFDEEKLKQQYTGHNFMKNLAVNKRYCFDLILRMLERYDKNSLVKPVRELLGSARTLYRKNLFDACRKKLTQAEKVCKENEFFPEELNVIEQKKQLLAIRKLPDVDFEDLYLAEKKCLEKLMQLNEAWHLLRKVHAFQVRQQKDEEEWENLEEKIRLFEHGEPLSKQAELYLWQIKAAANFTQKDYAKALLHNETYLEILRKEKALLRRFPERYLSTLSNYLVDCLKLKKKEKLKNGIKLLENAPQEPAFKSIKRLKARVFRQKMLLLLNQSLEDKNYASAKPLLPVLAEGLNKYQGQISRHHKITLLYLAAYLLFKNKDYNNALEWLNQLLLDRKEDVLKDLFKAAYLLNLILHYELDNWELLHSLIASTRRKLNTQFGYDGLSRLLLTFLGKAIKLPDAKDTPALRKEFVEKATAAKWGRDEKILLNYLDVMGWWG